MVFHIRITHKAANWAFIFAEDMHDENQNQNYDNWSDVPCKQSATELPQKSTYN